MKRFAILVFFLLPLFAGAQESLTFLEGMYNRYHGKWRKSLVFTQKTEKYRNDSMVGEETRYETMVYPKNFRIDFGEPGLGNCLISRNDSTYVFRAHKLVRSMADTNDLLYSLGGMYFAPSFQEVRNFFVLFGVDPVTGFRTQWHGRAVFVIGAASEAEQHNQLWVETESYKVVRLVTYSDGKKQDAHFSGHKRVGGAPCETIVSFYIDGALRQKEVYKKLRANVTVPPSFFSLHDAWAWHWRK